jgi:hypothetical protein
VGLCAAPDRGHLCTPRAHARAALPRARAPRARAARSRPRGWLAPQPARSAALTVDDVAFGVLTSDRFLETRLASLRSTWLRGVRHVVFYSESVIASLPTVRVEPPAREELVGGGAWKNFPALLDLHRRFPDKKWVFFHDDDTYVFVSNLLRVLGKYNHNRDYYVGLYWTPRVDMEWREVQIAYASGGAGYALSRALLARLAPIMPTCHANYTKWAGDVRVGKCIHDLKVRITPAVGFHHEGHDKYVWDSSGGGFPYGHLSNHASASITSPVTFHHLGVDSIFLYQRMQYAEERGPRGERYRYDFSRFFLKEYMAFAPLVSHRFRLLFGVSLEVAEGRIDQAGSVHKGWRRDFADPLYVRAAAPRPPRRAWPTRAAPAPPAPPGRLAPPSRARPRRCTRCPRRGRTACASRWRSPRSLRSSTATAACRASRTAGATRCARPPPCASAAPPACPSTRRPTGRSSTTRSARWSARTSAPSS